MEILELKITISEIKNSKKKLNVVLRLQKEKKSANLKVDQYTGKLKKD